MTYHKKHITTTDLDAMQRFYRGNLINSITGFKSANLLATRSDDGVDNVAIFSSVTHLGSNPPLFSFIQRPLGHGVGHTYENLKATNSITLNHIKSDLLDAAHQSSAKYDAGVSEFEELEIPLERIENTIAPAVAGAAIQVLAQYENEYLIKENNCIMVLCRITDIIMDDHLLKADGWVDLTAAQSLAINGLDGYSEPQFLKRLSYAKKDEPLRKLDRNGNTL